MSPKTRVQIEASELAQLLYDSLVVKRAINLPSKLIVCKAIEPLMQAKTVLYQFASVVLAVSNKKKSDLSFMFVEKQLTLHYTRSLKVSSAIKDFKRIVGKKEKEMYIRWARDWLSEIGAHEIDPAILFIFTYGWRQHYLLAAATLDRIALRPTS
jgi:hypothetical protein